MRGWRKKNSSASHGAPKLVAQRIHERPNVKKMRLAFNFRCQKLEAEYIILRLAIFQHNRKWPNAKKIASAPVGTFELQPQKLQDMSSANYFAFGLQLLVPKVQGPTQRNLLWPQIELLSSKFESSTTCWMQFFFAFDLELSASQVQKNCVVPSTNFRTWSLEAPTHAECLASFKSQPCLKLPSLELEGFKRGQSKLSCFGWASMQLKKLQNIKTLKKLKTNKYNGKCLEEKKWKHEIGKAWKLTSSCCVVYVSPTSYKNKNTRNIHVKFSSKILGFPTHLFQKTKLGNAISSTISSSLHTRNIFSLILATGPNGHNSNPLNLF